MDACVGLSNRLAALHQCTSEGNTPSHLLSTNPTDSLALHFSSSLFSLASLLGFDNCKPSTGSDLGIPSNSLHYPSIFARGEGRKSTTMWMFPWKNMASMEKAPPPPPGDPPPSMDSFFLHASIITWISPIAIDVALTLHPGSGQTPCVPSLGLLPFLIVSQFFFIFF